MGWDYVGRQSGVSLEDGVLLGQASGGESLMRRTELTTLAPSFRSFRPYGIGDGLGQRRLFQGDAADAVDEDIGGGGEDQAHLVGLVGARAHAVGEQVELAVLDAVSMSPRGQ